MIITKNGIVIRQEVEKLRVMGRATQGVKLINLGEEDAIAAVTKVPSSKEEENEELSENPENVEVQNIETQQEGSAENNVE
jgi:DNA gyrase subunit A